MNSALWSRVQFPRGPPLLEMYLYLLQLDCGEQRIQSMMYVLPKVIILFHSNKWLAAVQNGPDAARAQGSAPSANASSKNVLNW